MGPLIAVCLAWAGEVQEIAELEWARAEPAALALYLDSEDPTVREAAATALGRLRDPAAVPAIEEARQDGPRLALARALALTPGSKSLLREWLASEPLPAPLAERAAGADGVRTALILGLGLQGDSADVPRLAAIVNEPWPDGAAAAHALGLLSRRKQDGVDTAVPDLLRAVSRPDPRLQEMAAWALSRIGMKEAKASEVVVALRQVERSTGMKRAWLLQAAWSRMTAEQRFHWLEVALRGPSRDVRVAVIGGLTDGDAPVPELARLLEHEDAWVRQTTVTALGRVDSEDAAKRLAAFATDDPWERELALDVLVKTDQPIDLDPLFAVDAPVRVRAGLAGGLDDAEALLVLAKGDEKPVVRTAAVARLMMLEPSPPPAVAFDLLSSADAVVREAAMALLKPAPPTQVADLITHLRVETDELVFGEGLKVLTTWQRARPGSVPAGDHTLSQVLERGARDRSARVRTATADLAQALGIRLELEPPVVKAERQVVLPSGEVESVDTSLPMVADVQTIASARVITSRGEIRIDLRPDVAPMAVANFAGLAQSDYYDGVVWHRVVPSFVVQTGCPRGDGWGGPGWTIPDEVSLMPFGEGAVGMARADLDTGGSQWFIATAPAPHLVGSYTWFGTVTQGMEVARRLERGDVVEDVIIERVSVAARP